MIRFIHLLKSRIIQQLMSHGFELRKYPSWKFPVLPVFNICVDALLSKLDEVRFIQVGGNDGIHVDPLHQFYKSNLQWNGYIFEPNPQVYRELKQNLVGLKNRVTPQPEAISSYIGKSKIYIQDVESRKNSSEISSMNKKAFIKQKNIGANFSELSVRTRTLDDFLSEIGWQDFELLQIDTEGHEEKILDGFNLGLYKPRIIQIEIGHLNRRQINKITRNIAKNGYSIYWGGHQADMVCVRSDLFLK